MGNTFVPVAEFHCHCNSFFASLESTSFLKTLNLIAFQRVSISDHRETQETRPFSAFKNVREEDAARRSSSASHCTSCLTHGPQTGSLQHTTPLQDVPHTFPILSPDAASWTVTMAGTESRGGGGCFSEVEGGVLYLVSLSGSTEAAKTQMGRPNQGRNIRTERQKAPKNSRRLRTTCPEAEGETLYCSPLLPPPPLYPHYLWDGLTRRAASPGSVSALLYADTHYIN